MARLTKEEKKVFDPSLLIQNQKWKADTIKDLTISGGGNIPGEDGPYRTPPPSETPPYPPREIANFLAPSGTGKSLSEEAYWNGFQTIMETTEAGSDEQNKRLNILWHQFQDQVSKPTDGMKISQKRLPFINIDDLVDPIKTLKDGGYPDPDVLDFPSGGYYRKGSDVLDRLIDLELVNKMKINPKVAMSDKMYRVTDWDKKQNNEAWKQFMKGNPNYFYKPIKGKA